MGMINNKMHEQSMVGRIWAKGGNFMDEREQSIMIWPKSMQTKTKQTQLESLKSHTHTRRYAISTKQRKI